MAGWLADQLPQNLAGDRGDPPYPRVPDRDLRGRPASFTRRFVGLFEPTADSVRNEVEALEDFVDVDTAPGEFVRWLGTWLGATVDASWSIDRQREVVRTVGREFPRRGTRVGLERVLTAITGAEVRIVDGGGVWRAGSGMTSSRHVTVRLGKTGELAEGDLHEIVQRELPIGVSFEIRLGEHLMSRPAPEARDIESMLEASAQR